MAEYKIVIANSVGVDSQGYRMIHYPSRWTTGAKRAYFAWYPWELSYLSTLLKRETKHKVKMLDACLDWLDYKAYLEKVVAEKPDFLVMESSTRTIEEDLRLALEVKKQCGTKLIFTGQHPSAYPEQLKDKVDYICIGEYEFTVLDIIQGKNEKEIPGLYPNKLRDPFDVNLLPWPEDEDIKRIDYLNPGPPGLRYKQIQAYGSRGCPYRCIFCVCSNLYYSKANWRPRDPADIVKEIAYLKNKYGDKMEGIFFDEESHNFNKKHVIDLCQKIIDAKLSNLHYTAMCMYNTLDDEMLEIMKKAGYYQIRVGVETVSEKVAEGIGMKGKLNLDKLYRVLSTAKKLDIEIYGTFLVGAPNANPEEDMKTINVMKDLLKKELLTELQISICTPQPGTPFYNKVEKEGWLLHKEWQRFDGNTESVVSYPHYPKEKIEEVYKKAVDIGHYYRGLISLKKDGYFSTAVKAIKKRGVFGSIKLVIEYLRGKI
ncbi:MAG: radical SAM protein [Elusimicrobiota bacterium]